MESISTHPETNAHGGTTCSRLFYGLTVGGGSSVLVYHTPSGGPRHTEWPWAHVWAHIFWENGNRMRWKSKREGKSWSKGQGKGFHGWHSFQQVVADKERHSRGDKQVLACILDTGTIQRQELSDLLRNIKGKLARATSWLPCQGGWPSWKGIEAVGEAISPANKNTASTVGP